MVFKVSGINMAHYHISSLDVEKNKIDYFLSLSRCINQLELMKVSLDFRVPGLILLSVYYCYR